MYTSTLIWLSIHISNYWQLLECQADGVATHANNIQPPSVPDKVKRDDFYMVFCWSCRETVL